jgi:hypothetical protein
VPTSAYRSGKYTLSLSDLEAFDPYAPIQSGKAERRFLCPLPGCADKKATASHRSLSANIETGVWHCHRCDQRGLLSEWCAKGEPAHNRRERARQALRQRMALPTQVAENVENADNEWRKQLPALRPLVGTPGATYLERRGLPVPFCHSEGVRFAPDFFGYPAVAFPVRDKAGRLVAVQGRYIDGSGNLRMRSIGKIGAGVFATTGALTSPALVLVEAPIDALSLALCGVPAIALCGKDNRPPWLVESCAFRTVFAGVDADEAGDQSARQLASMLRPLAARVLRLQPEGAKDWNELLMRHGVDTLRQDLAAQLAAYARPQEGSEDTDLRPLVNSLDFDLHRLMRPCSDDEPGPWWAFSKLSTAMGTLGYAAADVRAELMQWAEQGLAQHFGDMWRALPLTN